MDTLKKVRLLRVICVVIKVAAVQAYLTGQPSMEIFLEAGFHLDAIGHDKPKKCLLRLRQVFTARGKEGLLEEMRGKQALAIHQTFTVEDDELHIHAKPLDERQSCLLYGSDQQVIRKGSNGIGMIRQLPVFEKSADSAGRPG
jgi:hypothetical protein